MPLFIAIAINNGNVYKHFNHPYCAYDVMILQALIDCHDRDLFVMDTNNC